MKFCLVGKDTNLEITVFTQSYPQSTDYWDGNWLNATIECDIPGFAANFNLQLRTDELKDFTDQLKMMDQQRIGKAALYNLDGFVEIEGTINPLGSIDWTVALCYPSGNGATLSFNFQSDTGQLQQLIKELEEIESIFPVVGTP